MTQFLTTHAAAAQIEDLITRARKQLGLVSPFLRLSQIFAERLQDAARRGVLITIVYGKEELAPDQHALLAGLRGLKLYFLPHLHAKCYFNETRMVITSMNMYEFSEKTNREMGVLLEAGEEAYRHAVAEVQSIIDAAGAQHANVGRHTDPRGTSELPQYGFVRSRPGRGRGQCIRCATPIPLNPERPLCNECFGVWSVYGNLDYFEQVCHACGRRADTSMRRPLCSDCFRRFSAF